MTIEIKDCRKEIEEKNKKVEEILKKMMGVKPSEEEI